MVEERDLACRPPAAHAKRARTRGWDGGAPAAKDGNMRLILRVLGTLLIAFAVILLIIDGTKSLAANALVFTPLDMTWNGMHPESLAMLRDFLASRLFGPLIAPLIGAILSFPGWAVIGIPGLLLAWAGRSRSERVFLRQDQI
jgi:hypothetical protein